MGRHKSIFVVLLVLIFLSFFGTLAVAASMFPHGYDWRHRVISSLLSPRDNPHHHRLAAGGVALTGLLMLPFARYLHRTLRSVSSSAAAVVGAAFAIGVLLLISDCFVVPQHAQATLGLRRLHEFLARSSAGLLAVAMVSSCWCAWKGRSHILPRKLFWIWSVVTILPLAGLFCSEFVLLLSRFDPDLTQPIRRSLRHSVFWHLGFWEWIGAMAVFVFLCAAVFGTGSSERMSSEK
jgi:hypothetical protein